METNFTKKSYSSFDEAEVICRQLNFKFGMELDSPSYPRLTGKVTLTHLNCDGNETHISQCQMSGLGESSRQMTLCNLHKDDLAVKCYTNGKFCQVSLFHTSK